MRKLKILVSNDDGVYAYGIKALYRELKKFGKVCVVAPLEERSTTGHSLTLHKPVRLVQIEEDFFGVSGSPADCIYLGIKHVLGGMPDMVVSGINRGANLGQDVYYSGTVSAAREACILGIPSLAVSLAINFKNLTMESELNYKAAAQVAARVVRGLHQMNLPEHTLLNLNIPDLPAKKIKGLKLAPQGFRFYSGGLLHRKDHRGRDYFWVGGMYKGYRKNEETDCALVDRGYAALTPLKLDSTDLRSLRDLGENKYLKRLLTV